MELAGPLGTTRCIPQAKFPQKPHKKSVIDQVCSVKMTGYWPRSFGGFFWRVYGTRLRLVHQHAKKRTWPISSHLHRTNLVNNLYFLFKPGECAFLFKFSFHSFSFLKYVQSLSNSVFQKIFYFLVLFLCTSVYKTIKKIVNCTVWIFATK